MRYIILIAVLIVAINAQGKKCGLPSFTDDLPSDIRKRVQDVWKDYRDGDNCNQRRDRTKAILDAMSPAERRRVFKPIPAFLKGASKSVRDQFDALYKDKTIAQEDRPQKFRELAEKVLNTEQMAEFNKFAAGVEKKKQEFEAKVAKLSPEAKTLYDKLVELRKERQRAFSSASESARNEVEALQAGHEKDDQSTANSDNSSVDL